MYGREETAMPQEIDLDDVGLSPAAVAAWQEMAGRVGDVLRQISAMRGGERFAIPDERARVENDGTLTIYVSIPGIAEIAMTVPVGQWSRNPQQN